jgi:hypothetical protein
MTINPRFAGVLFLTLGGGVGCTAYSTMKNVPLDCTADSDYDIQYVDMFTPGESVNFWSTPDDSINATMAVTISPLTDGARCGSTAALEIQADNDDDWGSLTGVNNFGPRDESAYQGLSLWVRAPGNTTKGFTILLDDTNTASGTGTNCVTYTTDAGMNNGEPPPNVTVNGMVVSSGTSTAPSLPNACGNSYATELLVTTSWAFYRIPFAQFQQTKEPNLVPNADLTQVGNVPGTALITSKLMNLTLRMPKGAPVDFWISNLGFYRQKVPGADGGVDAAQH